MSFNANSPEDSELPPTEPPNPGSATASNDELIKMSLTGSRHAIQRMVHLLHRANIIGGSEWSRPVATQKSGECVSVATRRISID